MADAKILITADTSQAQRAIERLEGAMQTLDRTSSTIGKALAGVTAAGAAVAVSFKLVADRVGALADVGKALGMTAQGLDSLQKSAQLAGIEAGELNAALFRLRGNIGEALVKGSGAGKDALDRLGLSLNELSRLSAGDQISRVTAALQTIPNPAERSALAIDLLGKQGPRLLEVAENAARLAKEAQLLGIALSDIDVRNLEVAGDALDELTFIADGALKAAMAELAPYVTAIAENLKQAALDGGGIGSVIRDSVIPAIKLATQAMAILLTYFVATKLAAGLIAATTALLTMYRAIKTATTAAAVLNAVLGKNPLLKIAGAVAGLVTAAVVVDQIGDAFDKLDQDAEAIRQRSGEALKAEKALREQNTVEVQKLNQEQEKALKSLEDTIVKLEQNVALERDKLALGETQANINKMIGEETAKLAAVGLTLDSQAKTRIQNAYTELETLKQQAAIAKVIEGLQTEQLSLSTQDKDQREIVLAIRKQELEFGRQLTEQEKTTLTNTIATTQALREQAAIRDAITNATRDQTELEKIQRGLGLQRTVGGGVNQGFVTSQKEYQKDQEALQALLDNKIISEQEYYQQREELARQYNLKIQELEIQRIQTTLMAERDGIAAVLSDRDAEVLQRQGANERQKAIVDERIKFEKMSEAQKTTFALDNMQTVFAALGAQNKKAFEASKALAIASALVNTYQGATKALATYPFPFGLIAAAAAVAAGMAQVSAIRSQQYSGRQLGGPVMGNKSYIVGENGPEMFTPTTNGSITRNGDLSGGGGATVNFTIVANDSQGFDDLLIQRQGMIKQMISDAMVERGQRSMI